MSWWAKTNTRSTAEILREFLVSWGQGFEWFKDVMLFTEGDEIRITRGLGRDIKWAVFKVERASLRRDTAAEVVEDVVGWLEQTIWLWDRPAGLMVGTAGRWRKFGRARGLTTKETP